MSLGAYEADYACCTKRLMDGIAANSSTNFRAKKCDAGCACAQRQGSGGLVPEFGFSVVVHEARARYIRYM